MNLSTGIHLPLDWASFYFGQCLVDAGDMVRGSLFIEEQQFYTYGKQYSAATDDSL